MRTRRSRVVASLAAAGFLLLGFAACAPAVDPPVSQYISAIAVPGTADASAELVPGDLGTGDPGGPAVIVGESATVVNGGSIQQILSADAPFTRVRVATAATGSGYWEVTLPAPVAEAVMVFSIPQDLAAESFAALFAVVDDAGRQGPVATQNIQVVAVGTGDVQVSVSWNADSDLDLHVVEPGGAEIYWDAPSSISGGTLDLDSNSGCLIDSVRNENITWPAGAAPDGDYTVLVDLWGACGVSPTEYVVTVVVAGQVTRTFAGTIEGPGSGGAAGAGVVVTSFSVADGSFSPDAGGTLGLGAPSVISHLKTVWDALLTPLQGVVLLFSAAVLTFLVALPGSLVSGALSAHWDDWFGWARRPFGALRRLAQREQPFAAFLAGVVVATLISAFIDPRFGFNLMSVRLYLTQFLAFVLFNVGAWSVIRLAVRRLEPERPPPRLHLRLGSLVILLASVAISRLLAFDPGVVFGLVAGLVYAATLATARRAIVVVLGSSFAAVAGLVSWLLYSLLVAVGGSTSGSILLAPTEVLAGVTILGMASLPVALLPLAALDGAALWRWRRIVWVLSYFAVSALFLLVMVTVPGGTTPISGDFLRWVGLYVVFAVVAVGVWLIGVRVDHRQRDSVGAGAVPGETLG